MVLAREPFRRDELVCEQVREPSQHDELDKVLSSHDDDEPCARDKAHEFSH